MLALLSSAAAFPDYTINFLSSLGLSKLLWNKTASNSNHVLLVLLLLSEQSPPSNDYAFMNGVSGNITLAIEWFSSFGRIRVMMVGFFLFILTSGRIKSTVLDKVISFFLKSIKVDL